MASSPASRVADVVADLERVVRGGHRAGHDLGDPGVLGAARLERPEARVVDQVRVHVGGQEDDVLDALQVPQQLDALGFIALPAVVGKDVVLLHRHLAEDHLEGGLRVRDLPLELRHLRRSEHRAARVVDRRETCRRRRVRERRDQGREPIAGALGRRRGDVGIAAAGRAVAVAQIVGAVGAEGALVEEEDLEVLTPADGSVEAGLLLVGDRVVVGERPDPALVELLAVDVDVAHSEREHALAACEVVDELVVVPAAVVGGRPARLRPRLHRQIGPVGLPLLLHGQGDVGERVARDLRVRVHRVAQEHVEVVLLRADPVPDLEAVPVRLGLTGRRARVLVAREGEVDRLLGLRVGGGRESAGFGASAAVHAEAVLVGRIGVELLDLLLDRVVVVALRVDPPVCGRVLGVAPAEAAPAHDLDLGRAAPRSLRPEDRRVGGDVGGGDAELEAVRRSLRRRARAPAPRTRRGRASCRSGVGGSLLPLRRSLTWASVESERGRGFFARVAAGVLLLVAAAGTLAAAALALGLGDREPLDLRVARIAREASAAAAPEADPLAWTAARQGEFESRAATGASHVIYEMSPGGVVASAERTAEFRPQIEAAAVRHGDRPGHARGRDLPRERRASLRERRPDPRGGVRPRPDHSLDRGRPAGDERRPRREHRADRADRGLARPRGGRAPARRARGGGRALRSGEGDRRRGALPGDRIRALRRRRPRDRVLPHGDRQSRERPAGLRGHRRFRRRSAAWSPTRASPMRASTSIPPPTRSGTPTSFWPGSATSPPSTCGRCAPPRTSSGSTATIASGSRRWRIWRPRRRRSRSSSIPPPRRRSSTIPARSRTRSTTATWPRCRSIPASAGFPTRTWASSPTTWVRTPTCTAPCARRRWPPSATSPDSFSSNRTSRRRSWSRAPSATANTRNCWCRRTRRRPRSTRSTPRGGRSTSVATTPRAPRRTPSSTPWTG